jgi:hypothetical protein
MTEFIRTERADGSIEYVNPRYDELVAQAQESVESVVPEIIPDEELAAAALRTIRRTRNQKLAETDWWANSDVEMSDERRAYRQALRDITNTYSSPDDVVWPIKPA